MHRHVFDRPDYGAPGIGPDFSSPSLPWGVEQQVHGTPDEVSHTGATQEQWAAFMHSSPEATLARAIGAAGVGPLTRESVDPATGNPDHLIAIGAYRAAISSDTEG